MKTPATQTAVQDLSFAEVLREIAERVPELIWEDGTLYYRQLDSPLIEVEDDTAYDSGFFCYAASELTEAGKLPNPLIGKRNTVIQDYNLQKEKGQNPRFVGKGPSEAIARLYLAHLRQGGKS